MTDQPPTTATGNDAYPLPPCDPEDLTDTDCPPATGIVAEEMEPRPDVSRPVPSRPSTAEDCQRLQERPPAVLDAEDLNTISSEFDAKVFYETGIHIAPFGTLQPYDSAYNLTVVDQPDGRPRGFGINPSQYDVLNSLEIADTDREFSLGEQALLLSLAADRALTFVRAKDGADALRFVLKLRCAWSLAEENDAGSVIQVDGGKQLQLS